MIEKIYIPTVKRFDNQITYNKLPAFLKERVVMVVQAWEADKYKYDCEYMILPDTQDHHYTNRYALTNARKYIYDNAGPIKYAMIDDDLDFGRRNTKYFTGVSNMEKSQRLCTEEDMVELFDMIDSWLDEPSMALCGLAHVQNPPGNSIFKDNSSAASVFFLNGKVLSAPEVSSWGLTDVAVAQDVNLVLSLLSRGYRNRISNEFYFINQSVMKRSMKSVIWDNRSFESIQEDYTKLSNKFPGIFNMLYDENGNRVEGGYRNAGKLRIFWSKAYNQAIKGKVS